MHVLRNGITDSAVIAEVAKNRKEVSATNTASLVDTWQLTTTRTTMVVLEMAASYSRGTLNS